MYSIYSPTYNFSHLIMDDLYLAVAQVIQGLYCRDPERYIHRRARGSRQRLCGAGISRIIGPSE